MSIKKIKNRVCRQSFCLRRETFNKKITFNKTVNKFFEEYFEKFILSSNKNFKQFSKFFSIINKTFLKTKIIFRKLEKALRNLC